jgi:hypothetical protein
MITNNPFLFFKESSSVAVAFNSSDVEKGGTGSIVQAIMPNMQVST